MRRISVGDIVRIRIGDRVIKAEVVEDRGLLGVDGEQIVRIRPIRGGYDYEPFEVPVELLLSDGGNKTQAS